MKEQKNKNSDYFSIINPKLLSWEFISQYIEKEPPFGQIGLVVYLRTYSRFIPELKRREKWWETCLRVVEYSFSLLPEKPRKPSYFTKEKQIEEAKALFDNLFNMKGFTSGRTLFVGGSLASKLYPSSNFNCSYCNVDSLKSFSDAMYLLLLGCGVGYSVESKHVSKLPKFNKNIKLDMISYLNLWNVDDTEHEETIIDSNENGEVFITVGDSKEGWVSALKYFLDFYTSKKSKYINTIYIDYSYIRPEGTRLKKFGGRASGHQPLKTMFEEISDRISSTNNGVLDSVTAMDIMNSIAKAIVVGGVRRCLPKGTLVHTKEGLIPIEKIKKGDLVKSQESYYPVINQWNTGLKSQLKIKTVLGDFICSPEHRVAVLKTLEGDIDWKSAKDLTIEDRLVYNYGSVEGTKTKLPSFDYIKSEKDYTSNSFIIPELSNDVAWLLGYLHGDGCVGLYDRKVIDTSSYVSFACPDDLPNIKNKVISILEKQFNVKVNSNDNLNEGCSKPRVSGIQFATYMSKFKTSSTPLVIPECILKGTIETRVAYLAGVFDSDGYMQTENRKTQPIRLLDTVYKDFGYQISYLLSSIGIASKFVEYKHQPSRKENWKPIHRVQILGHRDIKEFSRLFINDSIKLQERVEYIQEKTKSLYGFSANPEIVKNSTSKSNFGNCYRHGRNLGWQKAEKVLGNQWFAPVPILSITKDGESEMYDIEVEDSQSFVVGNGLLVHNSSQIAFGDFDDIAFSDAKKNLWSDPIKAKYQTTRVLSNNSVHLWEKPSFQILKELFETIKNNGEPGISIAENAAKRRERYSGSNPCFTEETLILTENGYYSIIDLVGKTEKVWDGVEWVEINNFRITGENQPVFKVTMYDGSVVFATEYHKFYLEDGSAKQLKELQVGERLQTHDVIVKGNVKTVGAYAKGFLIAEGTNIDKIKPKLNVYETKYSCLDRLLKSINEVEPKSYGSYEKLLVTSVQDTKNCHLIQGLSARRHEFLDYSLKYKTEFPAEVFNWCDEDKFEFIAGYLDGDGTAMDTKKGFAYQVTCVSKEYLLGFQTLLKTIGVYSKLAIASKNGRVDFNDGYGEYEAKEAYRLTILQESSINLSKKVKFSRLTSFANKTTTYKIKSKRNIIESIEYSHIAEKVYCLTNQKSGKVSLGIGLITGQCHEILLDDKGVCNLTTENLLFFVDAFGNFMFEEAKKSIKLLTRVGSRITLVDMWDKDWDYTQKRDRLLGVSLTGIVEAYNALNDSEKLKWEYYISELKRASREEADEYHDALGIPRSYLVTCCKPEGTLSQLPTVSSGIHAPYAPYYIRRVRVSKNDPIAKALVDLGLVPVPENGQGNDINSDNCNTWVFSFYVKTKATKRAIDESAIEQLERYKFFMKNWAEHTVSVTITVAENEWDDVVDWVWKNWDYCIGIAFLPRFDPSDLESPYPNMPYESSSQAEYKEINISENELVELISKYEVEYEEYELDASCGSVGSCPVR